MPGTIRRKPSPRIRVACVAAGVGLVIVGGCGDAGPAADARVAPAPTTALAQPSPSLLSLAVTPGRTACDAASGRVLRVGPGASYAVPSAAAAAAQAGDVVKIAAGDYRGDVATWRAANLTICGVGGRARLFADGKSAQGKAIWVVAGANAVIEDIEFHGVTVPDQNGAGIRAEGGNLTVRNCGFYDSDEGILSGRGGDIVIDRSEFARNGHGDGQSHNLYIGEANRLIVTASFFHSAKIGHNFKSRARETHIENSYFMDGTTGTASYQVDFPNGGVVRMRGNVFQKGPRADNAAAIAFGQEGLKWPTNTLEMVHNTVVSTYSGGSFIVAHGATQSVHLVANLFAGTGSPRLVSGGVPSGRVHQQHTVVGAATDLPGATNVNAPNFWADASLRARLGLSAAADPTYVQDAPRPFATRVLASGARLVGALQSSP